MAEKNFKIASSGLDLNGLVLAANAISNTISFNGDRLATKNYVDGIAQGLDVKASVRLATTENIDLVNFIAMNTIDGVNPSIGNRILVKNQTITSENGIYIILPSSGLERAADANSTEELNKGGFTFVEDGSVNAGKGFVVTAAGTLNSDPITWAQFSEAGALTAGTGIFFNGSAITVNVNAIINDFDGSGLYVSNNQLAVNVNAFVDELDGTGLYLTNSGGGLLAVNVNAIINDFDGSGLYVSNNQLAVNVNAIVADLDGSGLYVDGVTLAVNTNVIATKAYVDSVAQGLDVKASVVAATTENVSIASFPSTIDGIGLNSGNRVLVKNQSDTAENGIYVYGPTGVARTADAVIGTTLTEGSFTFVENGSTNAGKGFVVSVIESDPAVSVIWSQFSEAGSLTAGSNIYLANNQINVNVNALVGDLDGAGLYVTGNQLVVNVNAIVGDFDGLGLYVSNNQLAVNVNALVNDLDGSGLYVSSNQLAINTNALAGTGLVASGSQLTIDQYAAGVRYNGTLGEGGNSSITTDTFYAAQASVNTYVTVGTIGTNKAFTLDVWMKTSANAAVARKSTVSGITDGDGNVEYTEYAIVDSATPVASPDILIDFNAGTYSIKAKSNESEMLFIIESKIFSL